MARVEVRVNFDAIPRPRNGDLLIDKNGGALMLTDEDTLVDLDSGAIVSFELEDMDEYYIVRANEYKIVIEPHSRQGLAR